MFGCSPESRYRLAHNGVLSCPYPCGVKPELEVVSATDGRVPGRRGQATRGRLLESTAALLSKTSWRDVRVIDIAREAGTSPATFYQYFENVEQAILVLASELSPDTGELIALLKGSWKGERAWDTAVAVVNAFIDYWERNRAVMRVVELMTEEGDLRFQGMRTPERRHDHPLRRDLLGPRRKSRRGSHGDGERSRVDARTRCRAPIRLRVLGRPHGRPDREPGPDPLQHGDGSKASSA